jgi:hypothetical protein
MTDSPIPVPPAPLEVARVAGLFSGGWCFHYFAALLVPRTPTTSIALAGTLARTIHDLDMHGGARYRLGEASGPLSVDERGQFRIAGAPPGEGPVPLEVVFAPTRPLNEYDGSPDKRRIVWRPTRIELTGEDGAVTVLATEAVIALFDEARARALAEAG